MGILLALGRKSSLPVIKNRQRAVHRVHSRCAPDLACFCSPASCLPLLFPLGTDTRSGLTRAMILITFFSAAYFAEIVRGGLQAVPKGQTEAAQASGMSPAAIQRLIVLPQALRSVIPRWLGRPLRLFKDTSLSVHHRHRRVPAISERSPTPSLTSWARVCSQSPTRSWPLGTGPSRTRCLGRADALKPNLE